MLVRVRMLELRACASSGAAREGNRTGVGAAGVGTLAHTRGKQRYHSPYPPPGAADPEAPASLLLVPTSVLSCSCSR